MNTTNPTTIDEYISTFPIEIQEKLEEMRTTIQQAAPDATEAISYQMPTYKLQGKNLVHFAAFKTHIGFYPTPSAIEKFSEKLKAYKTSKGAIQFPLDQPLPIDLVENIVVFRIKEIINKT